MRTATDSNKNDSLRCNYARDNTPRKHKKCLMTAFLRITPWRYVGYACK